MLNLIQELQSKDNNRAYQICKEVLAKSMETNKYYTYFDEFLRLLSHPSSFVRTRGFVLACAQTPWDEEEKLEANLEVL